MKPIDAQKYQALQVLAGRIFEDLFPVTMRQIDAIPMEQLKDLGFGTVGDRRIDSQLHNEPILCYWPIAEMVGALREGINFAITSEAEAYRAYQLVNGYLEAIKQYSDVSLNADIPPMEDLAGLDQLAAKLYGYSLSHAAFSRFNKPAPSPLVSPWSLDGLEARQRPPLENQKAPERFNYVEYFSKYFSERGKGF
jgi:hypothetical protein